MIYFRLTICHTYIGIFPTNFLDLDILEILFDLYHKLYVIEKYVKLLLER